MTHQPNLTDAAIEAMLARRVGRGAPADLVRSITVALDALPAERRPWWAALAPPAGWSPAVRMTWILAVVALLLAVTVSAVFVGSQLLRRPSEMTVVPPPIADLTITAHPEGVRAIAWSPDGTRIATADSGGTAKTWDAATGEELATLLLGFSQGFLTAGAPMAYNPAGTRLAMGSRLAVATKVFDAATGAELDTLTGALMAYSPDGTRIATAELLGWGVMRFRICDAATGDELVILRASSSWRGAMAWSPDGGRVGISVGSGIWVQDATTAAEQLWIDLGVLELAESAWDPSSPATLKVTDLAWSPDGTRIAVAGPGGLSRILDAATGDDLVSLPDQAEVEWAPDSTRLATVALDGSAQVWDARRRELLVILDATRVTDIAWSPDGTRVAVASEDGTARILQAPAVVVDLGPTDAASPIDPIEP